MDTLHASTPGLRLRAARKAARLTQADLATRLGLLPQYISDVELGRRRPTLDWLDRAAAAIGCDSSELDGRLAAKG